MTKYADDPNAYAREYRLKNRDKCRAYWRQYNRKYFQALRAEVIKAYGGKCSCCGETELKFLTIDHVNNDGYAEREPSGARASGTHVYRKLKREGFPKDGRYQILCWNCNCGRNIKGGICPHQHDQVRMVKR